MNSSSVSSPSKDDAVSPVRRSMSTPVDDRLTSRNGDQGSDEDGMFESPWSAMLGSVGDTLPVGDTGSYVYLLSEGEEEEEEEEEEIEEEEEEGIGEGVVTGELLDEVLLDETGDDVVIVVEDEDDSCKATDGEEDNEKPMSASVISMTSQDAWASDSLDNLTCNSSCQWAWIVADLLYRKYGEKMSRLRNNIEDRLINFRSRSIFKSAVCFVPQPLPEDDDVSMLPLIMKN